MCGRYYYDTKLDKLKEILTNAYRRQSMHFEGGEIFPTQIAPVLMTHHQKIYAYFMHWGFQKKIINARSESLLDKPYFKELFLTRRCVIPMAYFFEWDQAKQKHAFGDEIYLAGFFNQNLEFTIITTDSQGDLKKIHHRMPICLDKKDIKAYLTDDAFAMNYIKQPTLIPKENKIV